MIDAIIIGIAVISTIYALCTKGNLDKQREDNERLRGRLDMLTQDHDSLKQQNKDYNLLLIFLRKNNYKIRESTLLEELESFLYVWCYGGPLTVERMECKAQAKRLKSLYYGKSK